MLPSRQSAFVVSYPKKREIFAAMFRDRIVHHLYFNYTQTLFERTFIADSYSCTAGRGTHYGINRLRHHIRSESQNWTRPCYAMNLDIRGYFMSIVRSRLLEIATASILKMSTHRISYQGTATWADVLDIDFILWLTAEIVLLEPQDNCDIVGDPSDWEGIDKAKCMRFAEPGRGLPIGNLTSQLFSNVYLNPFDQYMVRELLVRHYGRYVDDSNAVDSSHQWLLSLVPEIRDYLSTELSLRLHMGKVRIQEVRHGVEFLGAFIKPYRDYISRKTFSRIANNMKHLDLHDTKKVSATVNSWLGVLSHSASYNMRTALLGNSEICNIVELDGDMLKSKQKNPFSINNLIEKVS
ncbi:MAG: RNA-directed DNA polymerase [Aeriscardovia sp.]|nr:RNA-directed DNA polymerase [Aeriscardovia sp.]